MRPESNTETYVALKLQVDNWRWSGVPFYLRTGKRLARQYTEIAIQFKEAPHLLFRGDGVRPNWLVLNIQPDEGISLSFGAKAPGSQMNIRPVTMDFQYRQAFGGVSREAYATLINDCIRGDATLFDRADSVEAAWELVDPIIEAWKTARRIAFPNYPAGSHGPAAADELIERTGVRGDLCSECIPLLSSRKNSLQFCDFHRAKNAGELHDSRRRYWRDEGEYRLVRRATRQACHVSRTNAI